MLVGNTGCSCLCVLRFLCCPPSPFSEAGSEHCAGATGRQTPKQTACALVWPFWSPTSLWLLPISSKDESHAMEMPLSASHCAAMERKREGSRQEKDRKRDTLLAVCVPELNHVFMKEGKMLVFSLAVFSCCHCSQRLWCFWAVMKMVLLSPNELFLPSKLQTVWKL